MNDTKQANDEGGPLDGRVRRLVDRCLAYSDIRQTDPRESREALRDLLTDEITDAHRDAERWRTGLARLIAACDEANAASTQQLGGVVIDVREMSAAIRALDGSVSFCGGWPNALKKAQNGQDKLAWPDEQDA